MTRLYRLESHTVWEPDNYVRTTFKLVDFLDSDFRRAVEGATFLRKGTQEWQDCIDTQRKELETREDYPLTQEQMQKFIDDLSHSEFLLARATGFCGLSYERAGVSRKILYDSNTVCEISYLHKRVEVFRMSLGAENILGDQLEKSEGNMREAIYYNGTLRDAMKEYRERDFTFSWWYMPWDTGYINNGERTNETIRLTPFENVAISDVFKLIEICNKYEGKGLHQ